MQGGADAEAKAPIQYTCNNTCIRGCCQSDRIPLFVQKSSLHILSKIAQGAESVVYKVTWDEKVVALKKPKLSTAADLDRFHKELQLLIKLQHPNIVSLVAAHAHPPDYMFLFDIYENGNLSHALHVLEWKFSLEQILTIFLQLGRALRYLHNQGVVHRDVKPANILLDSKQGAHLADFGLAAYTKDLEKPSLGNWKSVGKPTGGFYKKNMVGTLLYMAPEVLNKEIHSEKADTYGLGITINELLTGTVPYTDRKTEAQAHTILEMSYTEQQLVAAITSGLRPVLAGPEHGCVPSLASLITKCWHGEVSKRPSLDLLLKRVSEILTNLKSEHQQLTGEKSLEVELHQALELSSIGEDKVVQDDHYGLFYGADTGNFVPSKIQSLVSKWGADLEDVYCPRLSWGVFATRGGRETMEDTNFILPNMGGTEYAHAFGVFDGHRGAEAAEFAANAIPNYLSVMQTSVSPLEALSTSFLEADFAFRLKIEAQRHRKKGGGMGWHPGCTAATALFANNRLFAANAGDCKIVLCRKGQAVALSTDHTANCIKERDRIVRAGGHVAWQVNSWRVGSAGLQVTRSIGDDDLKPAVTAEPEIFEVLLSPEDEFLVIASDGLWDTVSIEDAISIVKNTVKDAALCSKRLATEAVERGSTDNITVIVIFLRPVSTLERVYYEG